MWMCTIAHAFKIFVLQLAALLVVGGHPLSLAILHLEVTMLATNSTLDFILLTFYFRPW